MSSIIIVRYWIRLCVKSAPISSLAIFIAPIPTIRKLSNDKAVGDLPLLPYSSMIVNSFLWLIYGILKSEPQLWSPNFIGFVLASCYFLEFIKYAPESAKTFPGSIRLHIHACLGVIIATSLLAIFYPKPRNVSIIGSIGVLFCLAMYASPLFAMRNVIQKKSAKSIPLPFTIATILNCACWSAVGVFDMRDMNIYLPSVIGLNFGLVQILLKLMYGEGEGDDTDVDDKEVNDKDVHPDQNCVEILRTVDLPV